MMVVFLCDDLHQTFETHSGHPWCKSWLELGYGNITFTDELDFDVAELDIVYEDSDEGASIL